MQRTAIRLALGVLVIVAAPACNDPCSVNGILGIWNTTSINGYSVPGHVEYESVSYEAEYVRWAFYEGGQCVLTQRVDNRTTTYDRCSYTVDQDQQRFTMTLMDEAWNGVQDGDRIALTDPRDVPFVLRRGDSRG